MNVLCMLLCKYLQFLCSFRQCNDLHLFTESSMQSSVTKSILALVNCLNAFVRKSMLGALHCCQVCKWPGYDFIFREFMFIG